MKPLFTYKTAQKLLMVLTAQATAAVATGAADLQQAQEGPVTVAAMFRQNGPKRIELPPEWKELSPYNRDPLAVAQWSYRQQCVSGTTRRITLYNIDMGRVVGGSSAGTAHLFQKWFSGAERFTVLDSENGFAMLRIEGGRGNGIVAITQSERRVTPLFGWVGGVKVVLVGEASSSEDLAALEGEMRRAIARPLPTGPIPPTAADQPVILAGKKWSPDVFKLLKSRSDRLPAAQMSLAYGIFAEASSFVPSGFELLLRAGKSGHIPARAELLRLGQTNVLQSSDREALHEAKKSGDWQRDFLDSQSEEHRFQALLNRPFDEAESPEQHDAAWNDLVSCGHREARMIRAKSLSESFEKSERLRGQKMVFNLVGEVPLEAELAIYNRAPKRAPTLSIERLKTAALMKAACAEEGVDTELFVKKADLSLVAVSANSINASTDMSPIPPSGSIVQTADISDDKKIRDLDRLVNSGSRQKILEAKKLACGWAGSETDRRTLVVEIQARVMALGRWRRFSACEVLTDPKVGDVCADQDDRRAAINAEVRFQKLLVQAGDGSAAKLTELRSLAQNYAKALWDVGRRNASQSERREMDRVRAGIETDFVSLARAVIAQTLEGNTAETVASKTLIALKGASDSLELSLMTPEPSAMVVAKELERLEGRMAATMQSIQEADRDDLPEEFKQRMQAVHGTWQQYRAAFEEFSAKQRPSVAGAVAARRAASVSLYIDGVAQIEHVRDREIGRPKPVDLSEL